MQRTVISGTADGSFLIERQQMANTKLRREMKRNKRSHNGDGWFTSDRVISRSLQRLPLKAWLWVKPFTIISEAEKVAQALLTADCFILAVLAVKKINEVSLSDAAVFVNRLRGKV